MDILTIENLALNKRPATMRINGDSLLIKTNEQNIELLKANIKNFELFRSIRGFCFRVCYLPQENSTNVFYDLHNVHESYVVKLRSAISSTFGFTLPVQELETLQTTQGNLVYTNDLISLQSEKQVFSIPKGAIKSVIELDNDIQLDIGDIEIVFNTTGNIVSFITDKQSEEVCIIGGVNCINPRSRSTLVFFQDYFVVKGSSYDHKIHYSDVTVMFLLKNESAFYLVLKLESGILQGQTKYESLVFLLTDKDVEVVVKDPRLKSYYSGKQCDVVLEIAEKLMNITAQESEHYLKCTSKVFDGHLYLLNDLLLFLPKSICIPLDEISHVEFSRINLSVMQAKTFDMTIYASKTYNFNGIQKDSFNQIELYFNDKNIKMTTEVIEDEFSEDSDASEDGSSNITDVVDSDE